MATFEVMFILIVLLLLLDVVMLTHSYHTLQYVFSPLVRGQKLHISAFVDIQKVFF